MQLFDDIALLFGNLTSFSSSAASYCNRVPILGDALHGYFVGGREISRDLRTAFSNLSARWDELDLTVRDLLSWDGIRDAITLTWGFLDDITGEISETLRDLIALEYSEITDFWGNVAVGVGDVVADQYSEITDFRGNVGAGVRDFFDVDFDDWIEDQAERVINLAGRVLDKVW